MAEMTLAERIAAQVAGQDTSSNATVSVSNTESLKTNSKSGDC